MDRKPSYDTCRDVTFIVEGSVVANLVQDSTVRSQKYFPIINRAQHERWLVHCKFDDNFKKELSRLNESIYMTKHEFLTRVDKIHKAKVESIYSYAKEVGWLDWVRIKFNDNTFLIFDFFLILYYLSIFYVTYRVASFVLGKIIKLSLQKLYQTQEDQAHQDHQSIPVESEMASEKSSC